MEQEKIGVGAQFRAVIKSKGITQKWLADQLFIKRSTLNNILSARTSMVEYHRKKLNELLGTSIGEKSEENG